MGEYQSRRASLSVAILAGVLLLAHGGGVQADTQDGVPFEVIERIAADNARSLWGDVHATEAIPYYGLDGEVIAYMFNFSVGRRFPPREKVIQQAEHSRLEGKVGERWGVDRYCHLLVSARYSAPTIPAYGRCLSEEFACGRELEQRAKTALNASVVELAKVYYITPSQKWYVYRSGENEVFIKIFPPPTVYSETEFNLKVRAEVGRPEKGDFRSLWREFESGKTLSMQADHFIPMQEQCPFYDWSYGCSPTAAAMLLAYWDNYGLYSPDDYANMVDFHFQRWDGVQGETDYQVPNLLLELALAMSTDTLTGGTSHINIPTGMEQVANAINGYSFSSRNVYGDSTLLWDTLTVEIDAGRPAHCSVPGHSITVIGYTDAHYVILHNTWNPPNVYWYYTDLTRVGPVIPGSPRGHSIRVTAPKGDTAYNHDGDGEVWHWGGTYKISWDRDQAADHVMIWLSTQGGRPPTWTVIEDSTANDGSWWWTIPAGTITSQARIAVDLREDGTGALFGCDGSLGNFIIVAPPAISVTPASFNVTTLEGTAEFRTMNISSVGGDTLRFTITDATSDFLSGPTGNAISLSNEAGLNSPYSGYSFAPQASGSGGFRFTTNVSRSSHPGPSGIYTDEIGTTAWNSFSDVAPDLRDPLRSRAKVQGDSIFGFSCGSQSEYCLGVEFTDSHFYVSAGQTELKVFEYDRDGNYTGFSFDQFRTSDWGWRDLAWDGVHLYGGDDDGMVTEFGTDGSDYGDFAGPTGLGTVRALAYDPMEDVFYSANYSSDIRKFNKVNPDMAIIPQNPDTFSIYGMAYDGDSPGGPYLWIAEQTTNSVRQWSIATQSYTGVVFGGGGSAAGGCAYSRYWSFPVGVVFYMAQSIPDYVVGYQISEGAAWLSEAPDVGVIPPGGDMDITVTFDASGLVPKDYYANILIASNDPQTPVVFVPVSFAVVPQDTMYMQVHWTLAPPAIDGVIGPAEWAGATMVDISDTLGQADMANPPGSAYLYAMNDGDRLYVAVDYQGDASLDPVDQIGVYFDENNDDAWATDSSEGNYWVDWVGDSARTIYRALLSGYRVEPPPAVFGEIGSAPNLQYELSMPFGTEIYELTAGPGDTLGLWCFALDWVQNDFGGWWQQTMPESKFLEPAYYGRMVLAPPPGECTLHVVDAWGTTDSTYGAVEIGLDNSMAIGAMIFTLTFDSALLTADSIASTARSSHMNLAYNVWSDSLRILLYSAASDSILSGSGPIAEVFFDVDVSAVPGDSTLIHMQAIDVSDPYANLVIGRPNDGWFHFLATPTPPLLLAPDSGSFTADNTPAFDWTDVPEMNLYRLQVDDDNDFSSPEIDDATLSSSAHTPGAPLGDTLYYWHVSSGNGFAWSDWSATWMFTIDSHVPNIPVLISPSDSSILSDDTPTFIWSKVAKVVLNEPNSEHKTLAEKATDITYNLKITLNGDSTIYQTADTTFVPGASLEDSTFVWQVQAEDEAANRSGYSPPYTLIIDTEPPGISNTTVWQDTSLMGPFGVYSTITDRRGVASAELWYRTSVDTNWTYLSMDSAGLPTDNYMAEIPLQTENNTTISYYIHAEDVAVTPNESTDPESGADSAYSFVAGVTGVAEDPLGTPEILFISQNYPNPFAGATQIRFGLPTNSWVNISIYSLSGQSVVTLVDEEKAAGYSSVVWDGRDDSGRTVSSGVYFLRFTARPVYGASLSSEGEEYVITRKLSVMR